MSPVEVEHCLEGHPEVREAAVFAVNDAVTGDAVCAVVVTDPAADVAPDDLAAWCRVTLAPYKVPTRWHVVHDELPRTASGKLVKRQIRDLLGDGVQPAQEPRPGRFVTTATTPAVGQPHRTDARGVAMAVDHPAQPDDLYWDPYDYALHADSHPVWRRMREEAPLYRNDALDFWALTRFQDVLDALVDYRTYSSAKGDILEIIRAGQSEFTQSMISEDPPTHTVHRQLLSRAFTPRAIKSVEDRVRAFAEMLLDDLIGSGGFDFVDDFGARVPGMVIAAMLGTPDSALEELRHLTDAQLHIGEGEDFDRTAFNESAAEDRAPSSWRRRSPGARTRPTTS